jgi:hypothetical protein
MIGGIRRANGRGIMKPLTMDPSFLPEIYGYLGRPEA